MKKILMSALAGVSCGLLCGCDWTANSDEIAFNSSDGAQYTTIAGTYINDSGSVVVGKLGSDYLVIEQAGNSIRVIDSAGSVYNGTVESPFVGGNTGPDSTNGIYLIQSQFTGFDKTISQNITFAGNFAYGTNQSHVLTGTWIAPNGQSWAVVGRRQMP